MQRVGDIQMYVYSIHSCQLVVNESIEFHRCTEFCGIVLGVQRQFVCTLVCVAWRLLCLSNESCPSSAVAKSDGTCIYSEFATAAALQAVIGMMWQQHQSRQSESAVNAKFYGLGFTKAKRGSHERRSREQNCTLPLRSVGLDTGSTK